MSFFEIREVFGFRSDESTFLCDHLSNLERLKIGLSKLFKFKKDFWSFQWFKSTKIPLKASKASGTSEASEASEAFNQTWKAFLRLSKLKTLINF